MENGTDPPLRLLPVRTGPVSASRMYSLPLIKGTLHSRQSHPHRGRGSPRPHEAHTLLTELFLSIMGGVALSRDCSWSTDPCQALVEGTSLSCPQPCILSYPASLPHKTHFTIRNHICEFICTSITYAVRRGAL